MKNLINNKYPKYITLLVCLFMSNYIMGVVKYDEGRKIVNGIQLLQDSEDPNAYYYLPQYPRLATNADGSYKFLCLKYVGQAGKSNGGLFHALVEFTLDENQLESLQTQLQAELPAAKIVGPVELMQTMEEGEEGMGSFEIVSAVLSDLEGEGAMTRSQVSSGFAPLTPGSQAVVAAMLNQEGATLLWNSLTGPTSDISVSIHAYYEAKVKGYNATVNADMSTVYTHFSHIENYQDEYTKDELRNIIDNLVQSGNMKVEVFDRSKGLDINTGDMEKILGIVTDKLTELMFDAKSGWAVKPNQETAVSKDQIKGRQSRGFLSKLFKGSGNQPYYSDNQYVLKTRTDIRTNTFRLDLSRSTTIKVPVHTSGNLGGLFDALNSDERYFRIVNLDDPAFEKREVYFQVDGNYFGTFKDVINFAAVNFRKVYDKESGHEDVNKSFIVNLKHLENGESLRSISFPRLGLSNSDWTNFQYQIQWSLNGDNETIHYPANGEWISSDDPAIALTPPFEKRIVEIDADLGLFKENDVATAVIDFAVVLNDKPQYQTRAILRKGDQQSGKKVAIYHDAGEPVAYRVTWYGVNGDIVRPLEELSSAYLFLTPPKKEEFVTNGK